jgi:hypothetical protein
MRVCKSPQSSIHSHLEKQMRGMRFEVKGKRTHK